jgi:hypothetical protein
MRNIQHASETVKPKTPVFSITRRPLPKPGLRERDDDIAPFEHISQTLARALEKAATAYARRKV